MVLEKHDASLMPSEVMCDKGFFELYMAEETNSDLGLIHKSTGQNKMSSIDSHERTFGDV